MSGWLLTEDASSEEEEGYLDIVEVMYRCCEMVWLVCSIEEKTALRENEDMMHAGTLFILFILFIDKVSAKPYKNEATAHVRR